MKMLSKTERKTSIRLKMEVMRLLSKMGMAMKFPVSPIDPTMIWKEEEVHQVQNIMNNICFREKTEKRISRNLLKI